MFSKIGPLPIVGYDYCMLERGWGLNFLEDTIFEGSYYSGCSFYSTVIQV